MIAYRAQYEPYNRQAMRLIREGALGAVRVVSADIGRPTDPRDPADEWRLKKNMAGGGSLFDIGIYAVNAARYLTGEEPVEISAMMSSPKDDPRFREVEDIVSFQLRFPSGAIAHGSCSYSYAPASRFVVHGSEGTLLLDPATDYYEHRLQLRRGAEVKEIHIPEANQFALEMDHLSQAIMDDAEPFTPGEEGLQDVRLMQAIYAAARNGRPIHVDWGYRRQSH
jgi:predicted dehydrogenase